MREHHRELLRELTAVGVRPRLRRMRSHYRIEWNIDGKAYYTITSGTPSDRRGLANARAHIRRQLRQAKIGRLE